MSERKFDLGDYVEVKDRIALFYELYGQGRLVTTDVRLTTEPDGVPRVMVEAAAYRSPEDLHPARGWSWMELPGKTTYTKGSELENTETSAWGRAIAALGILVDRSIASQQEVANKSGTEPPTPEDEQAPAAKAPDESLELLGRLRKAGTIRKGTAQNYKLEARETPDGYLVGFRLELDDAKDIPQVYADGELGRALVTVTGGDVQSLLGQKATVRGLLYSVHVQGRRSYYRLHLTEIATDEFTLPAPAVAEPPSTAQQPSDSVSMPEHPVPLFDGDEEARLDAALSGAKR